MFIGMLGYANVESTDPGRIIIEWLNACDIKFFALYFLSFDQSIVCLLSSRERQHEVDQDLPWILMVCLQWVRVPHTHTHVYTRLSYSFYLNYLSCNTSLPQVCT